MSEFGEVMAGAHRNEFEATGLETPDTPARVLPLFWLAVAVAAHHLDGIVLWGVAIERQLEDLTPGWVDWVCGSRHGNGRGGFLLLWQEHLGEHPLHSPAVVCPVKTRVLIELGRTGQSRESGLLKTDIPTRENRGGSMIAHGGSSLVVSL